MINISNTPVLFIYSIIYILYVLVQYNKKKQYILCNQNIKKNNLSENKQYIYFIITCKVRKT